MLTNKSLSDAVGQDRAKRNFSPQSKADAETIIANTRRALREEIEQLPWLSAQAKQEALKKVDTMREKIGYPPATGETTSSYGSPRRTSLPISRTRKCSTRKTY